MQGVLILTLMLSRYVLGLYTCQCSMFLIFPFISAFFQTKNCTGYREYREVKSNILFTVFLKNAFSYVNLVDIFSYILCFHMYLCFLLFSMTLFVNYLEVIVVLWRCCSCYFDLILYEEIWLCLDKSCASCDYYNHNFSDTTADDFCLPC